MQTCSNAARFQFVGPAVTPRPDAPPFPFEELDGRPLLLVSLGTAVKTTGAFFTMCREAFANAPYQVVMAVGENLPPMAESLPANFIVRESFPQLELIAAREVFLSHGGMNSVNESLYYNVPLVMIPQGGNTDWVARRVVELGAGIRLERQHTTAERLRDAVHAVTSNQAYRARRNGLAQRSARPAERRTRRKKLSGSANDHHRSLTQPQPQNHSDMGSLP